MNKSKMLISALFASVLLAGCSSLDEQTGERKDPLESYNRPVFNFNYNVVDKHVLRPVAKGWNDYVPTPIRKGVVNVANNLDEPASFVNRLLQGEFKQALIHFNRFWINSTFGLAGLIDVASYSEPLRIEGDSRFGDTLGKYGVGDGPYVQIPLLGAANPRNTVGDLADYAYPMLSLIVFPWSAVKWGVQGIDKRANLLDKDALLEQAQDPYVTLREAYFQNLEYRIHGEKAKKPATEVSQDVLKDID